MQHLNLESNKLRSLPAWLSRSPNVQQLLLSYNPLSALPLCHSSWPALVDLSSNDCQFGPAGLLHLWRGVAQGGAGTMVDPHVPMYRQVWGRLGVTCACVCVRVCVACVHVYVYVCACVYVYVYVYVCVCVWRV